MDKKIIAARDKNDKEMNKLVKEDKVRDKKCETAKHMALKAKKK
jgi:hypothetical protein